ncbi:MAG TPA: DUF6596 domain-containing protein [Candidatus Xenobia bacterium]|jgi:RNA polymerase sigma-70 factor (ECF subfamily)
MELSDHLFRREAGRMVATLTRILGPGHLGLAEDVVQDAFCRALEVWPFRGLPKNPSAWLMTTARNRALDVIRRHHTAQTYEPELKRSLDENFESRPDDLLRMMFSCCQPPLSEAAQIALILHILCGFSVDEVAGAFVQTHAAVEKRITRGKKALAACPALFDVEHDFDSRLPAVQRALYLLFNEGYHGVSAVRSELCQEAMRLTAMLVEHRAGPTTYALASLMCLSAARLPARLDETGQLEAFHDQARSRWDSQLIDEGLRLLELSGRGSQLSPWHLEAAIAAQHAVAPSVEKTDWPAIVSFYDALMDLAPSPVVALNRAIAVGQAEGPRLGMEALRGISDRDRLRDYPFHEAAMGEFELRLGDPDTAAHHFQAALKLARNPSERTWFTQRLAECDKAMGKA